MKKNNPRKNYQEDLEVVRRYERSNKRTYFDTEEVEIIFEYYLDKEEDVKAAIALDLGLRLHPHSEELKLKKVQILTIWENFDKALEVLDNEIDPDDIEALFWRGNIFVQQDKIEQALEIYNRLLEQEKDDEHFDDLCLDIAYTFNKDEYISFALQFLEKGFKFNPQNHELLLHYANLNILSENFEKAINILNKLLDQDPYHQYAWKLLSSIYYSLKNYIEALEAIEFAILLKKKDTEAWSLKGEISFHLNNFDNAISCFKNILKLSQNTEKHAAAYEWLGDSYESKEEYENALYFYQESIRLNQILCIEDTRLYINCLACLLELEHFEECETLAKKCLIKFPDMSIFYNYYAEACLGQNKQIEGKNAFIKSLELDSEQPTINFAIGNICLYCEDYNNAIEHFRKAYDLEPNGQTALLLACSYFKTKDTDKAKDFFAIAYDKIHNSTMIFLERCPEGEYFINDFLENKNTTKDEK